MYRTLALVFVVACIQSASVVCPDDGRVCPVGFVCASVTDPDEKLCVKPDQISDCNGKAQLDPCETGNRCYDGVCLPAGCGNGRVDPGEACDDGNTSAGDGCSADCLSNETCGNGVVDPIDHELCDDGNLLGHDNCTSTCSPESPTWLQLTYDASVTAPLAPIVPVGRWQAAVAYDVARGKLVLFGGLTGMNPDDTNNLRDNGETWEWDGLGWQEMSVDVAPSPRHGHAMAYDPSRRRVVMFGGGVIDPGTGNDETLLNDTWEWDGVRWREIPLSSGTLPPPRTHHAMVYDPVRKNIVMVGGDNEVGGQDQPAAVFQDTWTWDGSVWTQVTTAHSPDPGGYAAAAFDPARGVLVRAGVYQSTKTFEFDGSDWHQVTTAHPGPMFAAAMAYDVVGKRMVALGGDDATNLNALHSIASLRSYDGTDWSTIPGVVAQREALVMASDLDRHVIVAFSGASHGNAGAFDDTLEWSGSSFTTTTPSSAPGARFFPIAATDPVRGRLVLFGGLNIFTGPLGDTWEFDGGTWHSVVPTASPSPRTEGQLVYDVAHRQIVLFGGETAANLPTAETWTYDGTTWHNVTSAASPTARYEHAMAYDSDRGRVVLFGGFDPTAPSSTAGDTWEWDGTSWTRVATTGPSPRTRSSMAYDPIHHRTLLFGGLAADGSAVPPETWLWDGTTWTNVSPTFTPASRSSFELAWDPQGQSLVMFGGLPYDDTLWQWTGTAWTASTASGPLGRALATMASDPTGVGVTLHGGLDDTQAGHNDTWRFTYQSDKQYESCRENVDLDGDGLAGCADPDCWPRCAPLCPPGVTCDPTAPHCGDGICNPALETPRSCPADCPVPTVCGDLICGPTESATTCPADCS